MSNIEHIAHELEDRIMDCWNVTSDIKLTYEEYLDSPESMSEDELSNILIGIEYLYNRKFQRLWQTFEEVCDHGGIWLDKDLVESANQHKDLVKVRNVPDRLYNDVAEKRWDFSPDKDDETEAMGQARLRKIQDSAAGRKPNKVRDAYLYSSRVKDDEPVNRKAVTQDEMSRFYNNGPHIGARQNDDGTWDMSAAARMATDDDVEHTKEYYDTERNKSQSMTQPHKNVYDNAADIQNMTSDGLSNRSMKQKHGRAVQTTSEMMQEELEPLPINTFE